MKEVNMQDYYAQAIAAEKEFLADMEIMQQVGAIRIQDSFVLTPEQYQEFLQIKQQRKQE